ncbi:hypothetical protein [Streptomyces sp. NPDC018321]|uniref:hypothetical protein n=1 Tax=unclassified Streptomyces TaxID=2593676 RepID=UPI0037B0FE20
MESTTRRASSRGGQKVWGAQAVRSLGARCLPLLDGEWMEVAPEDLPLLLDEILLLRAHLGVISATVGVRPREIGDRLDNIEAATRRARRIGAGALIR